MPPIQRAQFLPTPGSHHLYSTRRTALPVNVQCQEALLQPKPFPSHLTLTTFLWLSPGTSNHLLNIGGSWPNSPCCSQNAHTHICLALQISKEHLMMITPWGPSPAHLLTQLQWEERTCKPGNPFQKPLPLLTHWCMLVTDACWKHRRSQ
jgi:hypothetical protein